MVTLRALWYHQVNQPDADMMSDRLLSRMHLKRHWFNDAGEEIPSRTPEPSYEYLPPEPDGVEWFNVWASADLGLTAPDVFRLAKDREINATWHPLRIHKNDLELHYSSRG